MGGWSLSAETALHRLARHPIQVDRPECSAPAGGWGQPGQWGLEAGQWPVVAVVVALLALKWSWESSEGSKQLPLRPLNPCLPSEGRGLWACGGDLPLAPQHHHQYRG